MLAQTRFLINAAPSPSPDDSHHSVTLTDASLRRTCLTGLLVSLECSANELGLRAGPEKSELTKLRLEALETIEKATTLTSTFRFGGCPVDSRQLSGFSSSGTEIVAKYIYDTRYGGDAYVVYAGDRLIFTGLRAKLLYKALERDGVSGM